MSSVVGRGRAACCAPSVEAFAVLWAVIAAALSLTLGRYHLTAVLVVGAALPLWFVGPQWAPLFLPLGPPGVRRQTVVLLLAAAALCIVTALDGPLTDIRRFRAFWLWRGGFGALAAVLATVAWRVRSSAASLAASPWPARVLWGAVLAMVGARAATVFLAPHPWIDSWTLQQEAATLIRAGHNPYAAAYRQIYPPDLFGYVSHFGYMPLIALFDGLIEAVTGDVRFGYALCEGLTAVGLIRLASRSSSGAPADDLRALAVGVLFLAHPLGPFVVQESWSEPLLLTLVVATLLSLTHSHRSAASATRISGLLGGLMVAAKQSNILLAPLLLAANPRSQPSLERTAGPRLPPVARRVAWAISAALLITAPFLLWDVSAFLQSTVLVFKAMPIRRDAFSLWTALYRELGVQVSGWLTVGLVLAAQLWAVRRATHGPRASRLERAFAAITLSCWLLYGTGRQSFANYHFLVQGLLIIGLALGVGRSPGPHNGPADA